jgi:hypothetical protein
MKLGGSLSKVPLGGEGRGGKEGGEEAEEAEEECGSSQAPADSCPATNRAPWNKNMLFVRPIVCQRVRICSVCDQEGAME